MLTASFSAVKLKDDDDGVVEAAGENAAAPEMLCPIRMAVVVKEVSVIVDGMPRATQIYRIDLSSMLESGSGKCSESEGMCERRAECGVVQKQRPLELSSKIL